MIYGIGSNNHGILGIDELIDEYTELSTISSLISHPDESIYCNGTMVIIKSIFNEIFVSGRNNTLHLNKTATLSTSTNIIQRDKSQSGLRKIDLFDNNYGEFIKLISTGNSNDKHCFIYSNKHNLYAFGTNQHGRLGITNTHIHDYIHNNNNSLTSDMYFQTKLDNTFLINNGDTIIDIQCGSRHSLFLTALGYVYCCGSNDAGQIGQKKQIQTLQTLQLLHIGNKDVTKIIGIAAGELHSLFVDQDHNLWCCGYNYCGQLGITPDDQESETEDEYDDPCNDEHDKEENNHKNNDENELPEQETEDDDKKQIVDKDGFDSIESQHRISIIDDSDESDDDDFVDDNDQGCIVSIYEPCINKYFVNMNVKIDSIHCGKFHSMIICDNGCVYTFGHNCYGNLGNGQTTNWGQGIATPYKLKLDINDIIDGSCGDNHNVLLSKSHSIIVFGNNSDHQCSMINKNKIIYPLYIDKEKELNISSNCEIEKIMCLNNETLIVIDEFQRINDA